VKKVTFIGT